MEPVDLISRSVEETQQAGEALGARLEPGQVVALVGNLGAGKTHFVKGMARAHGIAEDGVSSPTFTIAQEYHGPETTLFHLDCYRLEGPEDLERTGAHEYIGGDGICVIEWPQRIESLLPADTILVSIGHRDDGSRHIRVFPAPSA